MKNDKGDNQMRLLTTGIVSAIILAACGSPDAPASNETEPAATDAATQATDTQEAETQDASTSKYLEEPLVTEIYTADPSVHVWEDGRIYVYPSHDIDAGIPDDDLGSQYAMRDYIVLSMDEPGGDVTIHPVGLDVDDVPWADKQMWAPDAAEKDGKYYLYFPAKDKDGIFRIGVAVSDSPTGPFTAEESWIEGTYSMDPSVFEDDDGSHYLYIGGIWGGQLQRWVDGEYMDDPEWATDAQFDDPTTREDDVNFDDRPQHAPIVAKLSDDMISLAEPLREILVIDADGNPIQMKDHERRFFEAPWVNKINGKYYLSYSTGNTHRIVYATGDSPYGPFTYQGVVLDPVEGWTNHHSIFEFEGQYYLAYHDTQLSGRNHLRNAKITPLTIKDDGTIVTVDPMPGE